MNESMTPGTVSEHTDPSALRALAAGHIRTAYAALLEGQGMRTTVMKTNLYAESTANATLAQALLALADRAPTTA